MRLPVSRFTVKGTSMHPSLQPGQDVLAFNWAYLGKKPKVGDIVVIRYGDKEIVKRIQSINDRTYFVQGDNTNESTDSRDFGSVNLDQIVGKVIFSSENHPERAKRVEGSDMIPCPQCESPVIGIYGRKDAICQNCGFKLTCCGEP